MRTMVIMILLLLPMKQCFAGTTDEELLSGTASEDSKINDFDFLDDVVENWQFDRDVLLEFCPFLKYAHHREHAGIVQVQQFLNLGAACAFNVCARKFKLPFDAMVAHKRFCAVKEKERRESAPKQKSIRLSNTQNENDQHPAGASTSQQRSLTQCAFYEIESPRTLGDPRGAYQRLFQMRAFLKDRGYDDFEHFKEWLRSTDNWLLEGAVHHICETYVAEQPLGEKPHYPFQQP